VRKVGVYVGSAIAMGLVGAALRGVVERDKLAPVVVEFDAKPNTNYVLDCSEDRHPWVWVTPEDER
jgi:hypothetical protein